MATDEAPSRAGSLALVGGGVAALDFANTASGRGGARAREHLRRPQDLAVWAAHAGVLAPGAAAALEPELSGRDDLLSKAIRLREAIHRAGAALARSGEPAVEDLAILRDEAAAHLPAAALRRAGDAYALDFADAPPAARLIGPLALSALALLRDGDLSRVKQCGGDDCGWLFYDRTKNNSRRWCEMSVCGNRSKAKRHRARITAEEVK